MAIISIPEQISLFSGNVREYTTKKENLFLALHSLFDKYPLIKREILNDNSECLKGTVRLSINGNLVIKTRLASFQKVQVNENDNIALLVIASGG